MFFCLHSCPCFFVFFFFQIASQTFINHPARGMVGHNSFSGMICVVCLNRSKRTYLCVYMYTYELSYSQRSTLRNACSWRLFRVFDAFPVARLDTATIARSGMALEATVEALLIALPQLLAQQRWLFHVCSRARTNLRLSGGKVHLK